ncbi:hypothetical protein [Actinoplanes sp. L3-i22]|nr:hypothetical protein [Actinoplanes sp. L3-i22]
MFNRPLAEVQETALRVAGWICPVTRQWIEERCGVPALLAGRPG